MKKLLALVGILFVVQGAQATSIMGNSLSYFKVRKSDQKITHSLVVYVDGTVVDRGERIHDFKVVTHLTGNQVDRINRLIRRARPVTLVRIPSQARCFAPAFFTNKFAADNGTLFLKEGDLCDGGYTINSRPAAKKLTLIVETLERAAHSRDNFAAVEEQIDQLLD